VPEGKLSEETHCPGLTGISQELRSGAGKLKGDRKGRGGCAASLRDAVRGLQKPTFTLIQIRKKGEVYQRKNQKSDRRKVGHAFVNRIFYGPGSIEWVDL